MEEVAGTNGSLVVALFLAFCTVSAAWFYTAQKPPRRWPLLGFLPSSIYNYNDLYEWITHLLILSGGTVTHMKGPYLTNCVGTADSANVEYILKIKSHNFVRGEYYRQVYRDVFGEMLIFLQDGENWKRTRTTVSTLFASASFRNDVIRTTLNLVNQRLLPLFQRAAREGIALDLVDVFQRYTFDSVSNLLLGFDPGSLALDLPPIPFTEAFDRSIQASTRRFLLPALCWKTLRFLNLGMERQIRKDRSVVYDYIEEICAVKWREMQGQNNSADGQSCRPPAILPLLLQAEFEMNGCVYSEEELRAACVSIIMAGRDTTATALAWFFWILQQHPRVEQNILMELKGIINQRSQTAKDEKEDPDPFSLDELKEMNYLQAALSESMRLYTPVPVEVLEAAEDDILPDGTRVKKGSTVMCLFYSMGRMESIWGKDCREFKPERWLENGKFKIKSELVYPVFSAGPRRCLGREIATVQMKWVTASIIVRYCLKAVGGQRVVPKWGMMMGMDPGLKVRVYTR
uniref:Cytochrome P450 CYP86L1 n=1 Tax=Picea glauca TaxID=3330 RepID=A0A0G7ZNU8_PICGL